MKFQAEGSLLCSAFTTGHYSGPTNSVNMLAPYFVNINLNVIYAFVSQVISFLQVYWLHFSSPRACFIFTNPIISIFLWVLLKRDSYLDQKGSNGNTNDKVERIWKEPVMIQLRCYSGSWLEGLRKAPFRIVDIPAREWNWCEFTASTLRQPAWWNSIKLWHKHGITNSWTPPVTEHSEHGDRWINRASNINWNHYASKKASNKLFSQIFANKPLTKVI
jgi:hypothetical protein